MARTHEGYGFSENEKNVFSRIFYGDDVLEQKKNTEIVIGSDYCHVETSGKLYEGPRRNAFDCINGNFFGVSKEIKSRKKHSRIVYTAATFKTKNFYITKFNANILTHSKQISRYKKLIEKKHFDSLLYSHGTSVRYELGSLTLPINLPNSIEGANHEALKSKFVEVLDFADRVSKYSNSASSGISFIADFMEFLNASEVMPDFLLDMARIKENRLLHVENEDMKARKAKAKARAKLADKTRRLHGVMGNPNNLRSGDYVISDREHHFVDGTNSKVFRYVESYGSWGFYMNARMTEKGYWEGIGPKYRIFKKDVKKVCPLSFQKTKSTFSEHEKILLLRKQKEVEEFRRRCAKQST